MDAASGRKARHSDGQPLVGALAFQPDRQPEFTPLTDTDHTRTRRLMSRHGPRKAVRETVWDFAGQLEDRLPGSAEVRWGFSKTTMAPLGGLAVMEGAKASKGAKTARMSEIGHGMIPPSEKEKLATTA